MNMRLQKSWNSKRLKGWRWREERRGKSEYEWEAWWTELILLWQCSDHWTEEDSTPPLHRGNLALLHMHKQQQQLLLSSLSRRQHQHERASSPLPSTATGSGLSESSTKQHAAQHHHSPITRSKLWKVTVQRKGSGRGNIELMKWEPSQGEAEKAEDSAVEKEMNGLELSEIQWYFTWTFQKLYLHTCLIFYQHFRILCHLVEPIFVSCILWYLYEL